MDYPKGNSEGSSIYDSRCAKPSLQRDVLVARRSAAIAARLPTKRTSNQSTQLIVDCDNIKTSIIPLRKEDLWITHLLYQATFPLHYNYMMIGKDIIEAAHQRIKPYIHRTPLLSSQTLAGMAGCTQLFLKCENFQKIGAFKARGAFNKLLQMDKNITTVCTHSSGNHAQALAYAATRLGLTSYIVMPGNSPPVKKSGVIGYGGNVVESGNTLKQREETADSVAQEHNAHFVHPYNDLEIIAGQATAAKEVFEDEQDLDYLVFPIGGGGLSSGCVLSTRYFGGKCKPIGVEPYLARDAKLSLQKGEIVGQLPPVSIADGLRTSLGPLTFDILREHLTSEDIILVTEEEIIQATQLVMERMKIVIEPSSATVVAAVLKNDRFKGKKVCCVISGGNVDMSVLFEHFKKLAKH